MSKTRYDYGECHVCGERMREQLIKQDFWIKGDLIVIEDVPAGVCPQCGEKVVNAATGQQLAALLVDQQSVQSARKISVPIISLLKKVA
jgi:HTH-type transcriptional regulator / antitoxin MqsA